MAWFRDRKLLQRRPDGRWELHLGEPERTLLASLADQLGEMLDSDPGDEALRRLSPAAYAGDAALEREWQALMGDDLRSARRAQLEVLRSTAERTELDEDEVTAWMQALNALRLVLGTRLDVSEDAAELPEDDPDAPAYALYHYLSALLDRTVTALSR